MVDLPAAISLNEEVCPGHRLIAFHCPRIARAARPGQFIHVRVGDCVEPLLRLPLSVHDVSKDGREVLAIAKVQGPRTEALAARRLEGTVDVLGPLGVPFSIGKRDKTLGLVGGGVGLAPLHFLAKRLKRMKNSPTVISFAGLRTGDQLPLATSLDRLSDALILATEDGSHGDHGVITNSLEAFLKEHRVDRIIACGPIAMLRRVTEIAREHDIRCEVSLERRMGCAVGVCLGCVVPVWVQGSDPPEWKYVRSCIEGPTFDARDIVWEEIRE